MNKYGAYALLFAQLIAHAALIYGFFAFSLAEWAAVLAVYFVTGCIGMSITFHRLHSHRSFNAPRWFEILGTLVASYGLTGSSIAWVNTHRAHHRYTDTEKDPHSPKFLGYFKVQWLSMFSSPTQLRYVRHLRKDPFHVFMHRYYFHFHLFILATLLLTVGPHLTAVLYLAPAAVLWNAGSFINTICHSPYGYRNYDTKDTAKNNPALGILMWGEGYHNNHHAKPNSAKFGHKWYEPDLSWLIIKAVEQKPKKGQPV